MTASETCGSVTEPGVSFVSPSFDLPPGEGQYRVEFTVANTTNVGPVDLVARW